MQYRSALSTLIAILLLAIAGCGPVGPREAENSTATISTPLPAQTQTFSVGTPDNVSIKQLALGAQQRLRLGASSNVVDASTGFAAIVNTGSEQTELGQGARSGTITSQARVVLGSHSKVTGDVTSAGTITLRPGAEVTGNSAELAAPGFTSFTWSVDFPASTLPIAVAAQQAQSALPGAYTKVTLAPGSRLTLSAGTYYFDALDVKANATLQLNTDAGAISIYVRDEFNVRGELSVVGPLDRVLLAYAGVHSLTFKTQLRGTLVAPNAQVRLAKVQQQGANPDHQGAVFAKTVELDAHVTLSFVPFSGWNKTTLTVRTFLLDETAVDQKGAPAGAGVYVRVNGETVGTTGPDGTLTLPVTAGALNVQAIVPSLSQGEASILVAEGTTGVVDIVLDDGKEVIEPTTLVLAEAADGLLPNTFSSFTLRFERDGVPVVLERVEQVELINRDGDVVASLDAFFELSGDALAATDTVGLLSALQPQAARQLALRVTAVDALGFTHADTLRFYLGQFRIVGTLTPPPSNPALSVANLAVEVRLLGTPLVFSRISDANGSFEIESVPLGNVGFDSQTLANGTSYYGQGTLFLNQALGVSLVMRSVTDVLNGVPPLSSGPLSPLAGAAAPLTANAPAETLAARAGWVAPPSALAAPLPQTAGPSASLSVSAAQQGVAISATAQLAVPKGTKKVTLKYNVFSAEYPVYVLSQSIFNDVWSLAVYGGQAGQQLFETTRNVNSQIAVPPIWQSNSSTGDITQELDVSALTATGEATLTLFASSMNVGDSALTTIVNATLSAEVKLTINEVNADTVVPTTGDSSYYSIPRSGAGNVFERWFTLGITKPAEATVTQVRVILRGAGDLMTLFEEAPGPNVEIVDDEHLRVRVSMHSFTSTLNSDPPPAHDITYRFRVQADVNGETIEDERDSGLRHALWRMPAGVARYGARDNGLDDWSSRGCYAWLQNHAALITRVDDISGEHARNIGHETHERGVDIDQFHYYTFPGGGSGSGNYTALRNNVIDALNGNAAAGARVTAWVTATRTGLDNLLALNDVNRLYYAIGSATQQQLSPTNTITLAAGWARDLLGNGDLTATSGQTFDTGQGAWSAAGSARVQYNAIHNTHIHIALNSALLPN